MGLASELYDIGLKIEAIENLEAVASSGGRVEPIPMITEAGGYSYSIRTINFPNSPDVTTNHANVDAALQFLQSILEGYT